MTALQDGLIAFLAAVGMTTVMWLIAGILFRKSFIPDLMLVLPLRGDAPAMEHDVREARRIAGQCIKLILADCGMTEEAKQLARYLVAREDNAILINAEDFRADKFY